MMSKHDRVSKEAADNDSAPTRSRQELEHLAESVIARATDGHAHGIREGLVMTMGPTPYRRLDCDSRALAYVRARPRRDAVRIDISGLWVLARDSPIGFRSSSGAASLFVRTADDIEEAVRFLGATVAHTRSVDRRYRRRDAVAREP